MRAPGSTNRPVINSFGDCLVLARVTFLTLLLQHSPTAGQVE